MTADLPTQLAATHARAFPDDPWSVDTFATWLSRPGTLMTGDARSFVLGHVAADEAEILTLATDPAQRKKGLARAALVSFCAEARERGARRAFLEVASDNHAARALYAAAGFEQVGRRPGYYARAGAPAADALVLAADLQIPPKI